eukprot:scaffold264904_cov18-Tisochrysis_lutea.AAC.2
MLQPHHNLPSCVATQNRAGASDIGKMVVGKLEHKGIRRSVVFGCVQVGDLERKNKALVRKPEDEYWGEEAGR